MEKTLFVLSFGFAAVILATNAGWAGPQCGPRAQILQVLSTKFGETRRNIALAANSQVIETFANGETGSWTITVTDPRGATCLVASGSSFETVAEERPAKGDPA